MEIYVPERKLLHMSDGRTMSLHKGLIDCPDKDVAKALIDGGHAEKPTPKKPEPLLANKEES